MDPFNLELKKSQKKLTLWTSSNYLRIEDRSRIAILMEIVENNSNSNCLFESLMQFIEDNNITHKVPLKKFRKQLVNYVASNWNEMHFGLPHLLNKELEETALQCL